MPHKHVLVASDFTESGIADHVANQINEKSRDNTALAFTGNGETPSPVNQSSLSAAITECDCVTVFLTDNNELEIYAARAAVLHAKKLIFSCLGYRSWEKAPFAEFQNDVSIVLVVDEEDRQNAQTFFPQAMIVAVGNPWSEQFYFPTYTKADVRQKVGATGDEIFILVAGEKEFAINFPLVICVAEAVRLFHDPKKFRIVFAIHPGHTPLPGQRDISDLVSFYQEQLSNYNPSLSITVSCKATPFGVGTPDMVPGADIVIGTNSLVQEQAACLRIPAIGLVLAGAFRNVEHPKSKTGWWPPYDKGIVDPIFDMSTLTLAGKIGHYLNPDSRLSKIMRAQQEALLMKPEHLGASYELIVKQLTWLANPVA